MIYVLKSVPESVTDCLDCGRSIKLQTIEGLHANHERWLPAGDGKHDCPASPNRYCRPSHKADDPQETTT